jgi:integrase
VTDEQLDHLAEIAAREHGPQFGRVFASYITFAAYTCMRPGEINALCWDDIDWQNGEVRVSKNIETPTNYVKWPKNGDARTINLPPPAADALRRVTRVLEPVVITDLRNNGNLTPFHLIFRGKRGGKMTEPNVVRYWEPVRSAFRVKHPESRLKDIYELRHKGATMLLERGLMVSDVALQMGHTDGGALVMQRYGHPSDKLARERLRKAWQEPVQLEAVREAKG